MDEIDTVEELKNEVSSEGQVVSSINILFLDVSSTCVGYSIAEVDFGARTATMKKTGAIWLDPNWTHAEKYNYMFNSLVNYFWVVEQIDYIVVEQYSINPKKMVGVAVVPEMMGVIKCAAQENGIKVSSILPQSWRKILGIKAIVTKTASGKTERDFKTPTKQYIDNLATIPQQVKSNITNNLRTTPSDLYDSAAICIAWLNKLGFSRVSTSNVQVQTHVP